MPAYTDSQEHTDQSESGLTTVTVSPRFQVVIPKKMRERIGLEVGQKMHLVDLGHSILLVPHVPIESRLPEGAGPPTIRTGTRSAAVSFGAILWTHDCDPEGIENVEYTSRR